MAALAGVAAHGGLGGAVVEAVLVGGILVLFAAVWLRERRSRSRGQDENRQIKPQ